MLKMSTYSTLGNQAYYSTVMGFFKDHISSILPTNFFKSVYIRNSSTSISEDGREDDDSITKRNPLLSYGFTYDANETSFDGDAVFFAKRFVHKRAFEKKGMYNAVFKNYENGSYVSTFRSRLNITVEGTIRLDTPNAALNILQYILNNLGTKRPYFVDNVIFQVPVPNKVIKHLQILSGKSIDTPANIAAFHLYLKEYSGGAIDFKFHPASGKWLYFMSYMANVLVKMNDFGPLNKTMDNKSIQSADIPFNFSLEFATFQHFIVEYESEEFDTPIVVDEIDDTFDVIVYNHPGVKVLQSAIVKNGHPFNIFNVMKYVSDINTSVDTTEFANILQPDMTLFIQHLTDTNQVKDTFVTALLYADDDLVDPADYTINWDTREVVITNPLPNFLYSLALYRNEAAFHDFILAERGNKSVDKFKENK